MGRTSAVGANRWPDEVAALPDVRLARLDEGLHEGAPVEGAAAVAAAVRAHEQQGVGDGPAGEPLAERGQREVEQVVRPGHRDQGGVGAGRGGVGEVEPDPRGLGRLLAAAAGTADELQPEARGGGPGGEPDDRRDRCGGRCRGATRRGAPGTPSAGRPARCPPTAPGPLRRARRTARWERAPNFPSPQCSEGCPNSNGCAGCARNVLRPATSSAASGRTRCGRRPWSR